MSHRFRHHRHHRGRRRRHSAGRAAAGRRGIYRSRQGIVFGVCRGLAAHFDISVFWTRALAVVLLVFTGLWPGVGLYLLGALLMKPEPVIDIESEVEREFYDSYATAPAAAAQRLRQRYQKLEQRIRRLEDAVTAREFDWDSRLNS